MDMKSRTMKRLATIILAAILMMSCRMQHAHAGEAASSNTWTLMQASPMQASPMQTKTVRLRMVKGVSYKLMPTTIYKTNDKRIVTVDRYGKIKAKRTGTAQITAATADETITYDIHVGPKGTWDETNGMDITIAKGHKRYLPDSGVFRTSKKRIVKVTQLGVATASRTGETEVTFADRGGTKLITYQIIVEDPALLSACKDIKLRVDDDFRLAFRDTSTKPSYMSLDPSIATVDDSGVIKAVGIGRCTVCSIINGKTYKSRVKVTSNRTPCLYSTNLTLDKGTKKRLKTKGSFGMWESDDPSIASVDEHGNISANETGTTRIRAINYGVETICDVTVQDIAIESTSVTTRIGNTILLPFHGNANRLYWKSSNRNIVAVNEYGVITAYGKGRATITASDTKRRMKFTVKVTADGERLTLPKETGTADHVEIKDDAGNITGYYVKQPDGTYITVTSFKIYYDLDGGTSTVPLPESYDVSRATTIGDAEKPGYRFLGWTTPDRPKPVTQFIIPRGSYGDAYLTARWEEITEFAISYDLDGGVMIEDAPVIYSSKNTTAIPDPVKDHYEFLGWIGASADDAPVKGYMIEQGEKGEKILKAVWRAIEYPIVYHLDGGILETENPAVKTVTTGDIKLNNPVRAGYTFRGWIMEDTDQPSTDYTIPADMYGIISITAKWRANNDTTYTVIKKIENADGTFEERQVVLSGTTDRTVRYRPDGIDYYITPDPIDIYVKPDGTGKGEVTYERKAYSVTVNKGVSISAVTGSGTYKWGTQVEVSATAIPGYSFSDWTVNDGLDALASNSFEMPHDIVTITANATPNTYRISFDTQGADTDGTAYVDATYDSSLPRITVLPQRNGYTFKGYYTAQNGGDMYYSETGEGTRAYDRTSAITLCAKWELQTRLYINTSISLSRITSIKVYDASNTLRATYSCSDTATPLEVYPGGKIVMTHTSGRTWNYIDLSGNNIYLYDGDSCCIRIPGTASGTSSLFLNYDGLGEIFDYAVWVTSGWIQDTACYPTTYMP